MQLTDLFSGKKGLIMGVANEYSIAAHVAEFLAKSGADIGYNYLPDRKALEAGTPDKMERRAKRALEHLSPAFLLPCDVSSDAEISKFFSEVENRLGKIDFLVHSIAFAPLDDIRNSTIEATREGFLLAMNISVYSFIRCVKEAARVLNDGASIVTMTYFGAEKVIPGYNMMGICKAALEAATRYLAFDLGARNIRVNSISAGPIKTLASSAVGDMARAIKLNAALSPTQKNITQEDVAKTTAYLLSDWSSGVTGENIHVDGGYHVMGSPNHALDKLKDLLE